MLGLLADALVEAESFIVFHFINSSLINDVHVTSHTAVAKDLMLPEEAMRCVFNAAGFVIDVLEDGENGYLLISHVSVTS